MHDLLTICTRNKRTDENSEMNTLCLVIADIVCLNQLTMRELSRRIGREEFDYQALMAALSGYANPRDKVTALLRRGDIIRVNGFIGTLISYCFSLQ